MLDKLWRFVRSDKGMELILYVIVGVITTLINIAAFQLLSAVMGVDYRAANVVAWVVSVLFAFVANKIYVFRSVSWQPNVALKEALSFFAARGLSLLLDMGLIIAMVEWLHMGELLSKLISNVAVIIFNYVLSKMLIFKDNKKGK